MSSAICGVALLAVNTGWNGAVWIGRPVRGIPLKRILLLLLSRSGPGVAILLGYAHIRTAKEHTHKHIPRNTFKTHWETFGEFFTLNIKMLIFEEQSGRKLEIIICVRYKKRINHRPFYGNAKHVNP